MSEKLYYIDRLAEVPAVARGNRKIKKIKFKKKKCLKKVSFLKPMLFMNSL